MESANLSLLDENQIVFPKLGIDLTINDKAFTIFGIDIMWYSLLITTGIILALIYGFSRMKKYGIDPDRGFDVIMCGIVGGIVGARVYYVIMSWESYEGNWKAILNIRNGGLAIYGGIIGSILVGGLIAKLRKVKLLPMLDIAGVGFLLGQGIGRWGNFTNQEAFGYNTDSIFGMSGGTIQRWIIEQTNNASNSSELIAMDPYKPVHPCFLYESVWCLVGFVILAIVAQKIRKFDGQIFLMYIGWYGLGRFFIEGLRTDSLMIGTLRISQVLAAICVIVSIVLLLVFGNKVKRMGDDYKLYCDTEESKQLLREAEERSKSKERKIQKLNSNEIDSNQNNKESKDELFEDKMEEE